MHWSFYAAAAAALAGAHVLRGAKRGGGFAVIAFVAGLAASALAIKATTQIAGFGRATDFDRFVVRAADIARQDDSPLIVFTGASFSRNAIDDERLTIALREKGYPHRAINLSLEAASMLERDARLTDFIARAGRAPEVVFVEVARPFDFKPAFIFDNSKFSLRAIDQFGLRETLWTLFGLAGGGCDGPVDCGKSAALVSAHAGVNFLNVGLLSSGEDLSTLRGATSFDGQSIPREHLDLDAASAALSEIRDEVPAVGPQWARSFRGIQRDRLQAAGVEGVGYYFPPVIDPGLRAYVSSLCKAELAASTCIAPDDPDLLRALDGPVWFDREHLLDTGAAIYVRWLADQLDASGALE